MRPTTIPTVRITDGDDYLVINEADFDPDSHTVWTEARAEKDTTSNASTASASKRAKHRRKAGATDTPPASTGDTPPAADGEPDGDASVSTPDGDTPAA